MEELWLFGLSSADKGDNLCPQKTVEKATILPQSGSFLLKNPSMLDLSSFFSQNSGFLLKNCYFNVVSFKNWLKDHV